MDPKNENTIIEDVTVEAVEAVKLEVFEDVQKEEVVNETTEKTPEGDIADVKVTTINERIVRKPNDAIAYYDKEIANLDKGITNNQAQIAHLQAIRQKYIDKKAEATKK